MNHYDQMILLTQPYFFMFLSIIAKELGCEEIKFERKCAFIGFSGFLIQTSKLCW